MLMNALRRQTRLFSAVNLRCSSGLKLFPGIPLPMPASLRSLSATRVLHRGGNRRVKKKPKINKIKPRPWDFPPSCTVIFRRVPLETTERQMRDMLARHGSIDFLCIHRYNTGISCGTGLVVFATQTAAEAAIQASARTPLKMYYSEAPYRPPSCEVHVSGVSKTMTEADLRAALSPHGEISSCIFHELPGNRTYAHVVFADQSAADAACKAGIRISHDITLHVSYATPPVKPVSSRDGQASTGTFCPSKETNST
ncbi:hypothetical protein C8R43DRAFT_1031429 [Mycena crocata]|nr:hypothetical protein C8R43DRAFT_1031429 [Mycena crocata]